MATTTAHLGLKKPDYTDTADIKDINDNMDAIDTAINNLNTAVGIPYSNANSLATRVGSLERSVPPNWKGPYDCTNLTNMQWVKHSYKQVEVYVYGKIGLLKGTLAGYRHTTSGMIYRLPNNIKAFDDITSVYPQNLWDPTENNFLWINGNVVYAKAFDFTEIDEETDEPKEYNFLYMFPLV